MLLSEPSEMLASSLPRLCGALFITGLENHGLMVMRGQTAGGKQWALALNIAGRTGKPFHPHLLRC